MKEAFLAALLSVGPGPDKGIELIEIVTPVHKNAVEVTTIRNYVPAIIAADTKADNAPQVIRHITAKQSLGS